MTDAKVTTSRMGRLAWLCLGYTSVGLGLLGVILPILPTTPFMLLAVFAFGKSSPRLAAWLRAHPRFGPMILDWEEHRAIRPRHKRAAVLVMALVFGVSVALQVAPTVLALQGLCLAGAATFILTRSNGPQG